MTVKISMPTQPCIGGGGVVTAIGEAVDQALYWELVSYDPDTGLEGLPRGSLKYQRTRTDAAKLSTNIYYAPADPGLAGKIDRVKVKYGA
jgi:hypothetical protein